MNLDLDFSAVSRFFRGILTELRQKRLWPVAALLLVALVAVPILLTKSAHPAPQQQAQLPTPPPAANTSLPTLNVQTTPSHSNLSGRGHNPFATTGGASSGSTTGSTTTTVSTAVATTNNAASTATGANGTAGTGTGGTSTSTGVGTSSGTAPSSNPPSITPGAKPKPAPSGLKSTQAYDVALAITDSSGGVNTTDPLQRLSVIPSDQQPLLVELGVSHDGNHVLFAVQPGAIPSGPGTCTPGPIDCEILSLGQDQTEQLSAQTGSIGTSQVALFAITGITATDYPSAAAADQARRRASAAGRALIGKSTYPTLSLFQYEPSVGSVVDLRNLGVS